MTIFPVAFAHDTHSSRHPFLHRQPVVMIQRLGVLMCQRQLALLTRHDPIGQQSAKGRAAIDMAHNVLGPVRRVVAVNDFAHGAKFFFVFPRQWQTL